MSQNILDFARAEVAKLEKQCADVFKAGSEFRPAVEGDGQHMWWLCAEYHRLSTLRQEARERLAKLERSIEGR